MNPKNEAAKGNCYGTAYLLMMNHPGRDTPNVLLCHGIVTRSLPPHERMGHAWLEELDGGVWWVRDGLYPLNLIPRGRYYEIGKISPGDVVRYSRTQAKHQSRSSEMQCGPWDPRIAAAEHGK